MSDFRWILVQKSTPLTIFSVCYAGDQIWTKFWNIWPCAW